MEKKEILEIIRKVVKPEKVKIEDYKTSSIRSVLFGQRNNDAILKSCIKKAIEEIEEMKSKLVYYEYTMSIKNIQPKNEEKHPFVEMDLKQKIEYLCKMKLKEIQELKKELIRLNLFDNLEHDVKEFLKDLKPNHLKMVRYNRSFERVIFVWIGKRYENEKAKDSFKGNQYTVGIDQNDPKQTVL